MVSHIYVHVYTTKCEVKIQVYLGTLSMDRCQIHATVFMKYASTSKRPNSIQHHREE